MRQRYVVRAITVCPGIAGQTYSGYVVYDRRLNRIADGCYLTFSDAQWAADQRNRGFRQPEGA